MDNIITDEELIKLYLRGDNKALELLIKKYLNQIYSFIFTYTRNQSEADDLTQETFVKIWKKIKKFNPDYKFKTWAFTIAKNTTLDFIKKKKAITFSELTDMTKEMDLADIFISDQPSQIHIMESQEELRGLSLALEELSPTHRATLSLRYNEDLKFREIADITKESIDTIKTRHRRAISYLKKYFQR